MRHDLKRLKTTCMSRVETRCALGSLLRRSYSGYAYAVHSLDQLGLAKLAKLVDDLEFRSLEYVTDYETDCETDCETASENDDVEHDLVVVTSPESRSKSGSYCSESPLAPDVGYPRSKRQEIDTLQRLA